MPNYSKENRHNEILESATELLSLKPTATLQEIADYANIGIATLHRHFASREALLDELAINAIELVEHSLKEITFPGHDIKKSLEELFNRLIPLGDKIYFLAYAASVDENQAIAEREDRIKQPHTNAIDIWKEQGLLNNAISTKWMVTVIYNLLFVTWQEIHSGNIAKNDAADLLVTTVLNGFLK
ncbi:TetR/AcrR family transcriptional regulator [Clostridium sp. Marseille-P2415]|uniref:TetR/AcrR family transcriptional regulator n=1 Tax=Clostridium sp. Marseille-P2415 TaxID=1805471 RepID=UPI0009884802|nr:TetR/AcrR family transcriptional regulator [Clostridium sp. Marseille-P2415]